MTRAPIGAPQQRAHPEQQQYMTDGTTTCGMNRASSKRRRCCRRSKQSAGRWSVAARSAPPSPRLLPGRHGTGRLAARTSDTAADDTGGPAAAAVLTAEVVAAHPGVSLAPAAAAVRRCRAAFRSPVTQRDNRYAHTRPTTMQKK